MDKDPMETEPVGSDPSDERDITLAKVRSELDRLAERRLTSAPTSQELSRWHELVSLEERLLKRKRERERDHGWRV